MNEHAGFRRLRAVPMARAVIAALVAVGLILPSAAGRARAADITLGTPAATATYGTSIEFTIPITGGAADDGVELRLRFPDSLGPLIVDVPAPTGSGTQTLRYVLDFATGGHLVPNTPIRATWAVRPAGGETVLSREITVRYSDTAHDWKTISGDLMTVHWYAGTQAFGKRALEIGEQAIRDTSTLLGVTETEPVDFFIYGDETAFRAALGPGTRENVGGQAHADIRTLFALITPDEINDPWVGIVVPHELVHLVFDSAVRNPYRFPPRWFNEGLAVYLSEGYSASDRARVGGAVRAKDLLPLDALVGQFPTDADKTYLAYAESVSAIDYLVRVDGRDALFGLIRAYKDGLTDAEAFSKVLGRDLATFQAGWLRELGAEAPTRYGPQPAPAGPLPPGWSGPGQTPGPGTTPGAPAASPTIPPGATPGASPATGPGAAGDDGGKGVVVLAVVVVVVIVAAGLLVARRRGAGS